MNSAGVREACRKIERSVPEASSRMQRDDDRALIPAKLHVAASLADLLIADSGESGDDSGAADDGECGLTQKAGRWR